MNQPIDTENGEPVKNDFADLANAPEPGIITEFLQFLSENKRWWLIPILVVLALVGILVFLSSSVVAPFIYPLF